MTDLLPPLLGLFRGLVATGLPIGVRDYLDGLRALQGGFGFDGREGLRRLAQHLWARSDAERRLIDSWFDAVPVVDTGLADPIEQLLSVSQGTSRRPDPLSTATDAAPEVDAQQMNQATEDAVTAPRARISFASVREGSGLPVPRQDVAPPIGEAYVLQPQQPISARELTVLWRRFRRGTRQGACTELDLTGSVRERCRRGLLLKPVLRPRRSNSARLLILADTSASMDPWRPWLETLAESLLLGRFARAEMHYFNNLPRKQLFATPGLTDQQPRDEVLRRNVGAALLVVSDAGSARGFLNRRRATQTSDFLAAAARLFPTGLWLNPMPRERWAGNTAALVAKSPSITMLPLDAASLLRGIDILRGNK